MNKETMMTAWRLINLAPVELDRAVSELPISDAQDVERDLEQIAMQAAAVAGYLSTRKGIDGTGVKEHAGAALAFSERRIKVRRALGFSYPAKGEIRF